MYKLLYDDGVIKISRLDVDKYHVSIWNDFCDLPREVFEKWAQGNSDKISSGLTLLNAPFLKTLKKKNISLEYFGWVIAKVRISELEEGLGHILNHDHVGL